MELTYIVYRKFILSIHIDSSSEDIKPSDKIDIDPWDFDSKTHFSAWEITHNNIGMLLLLLFFSIQQLWWVSGTETVKNHIDVIYSYKENI